MENHGDCEYSVSVPSAGEKGSSENDVYGDFQYKILLH